MGKILDVYKDGTTAAMLDSGKTVVDSIERFQIILSGERVFMTRTDSELLDRNGEAVTVEFQHPSNDPEHSYDIDEVGLMYRIRFSDGFEATAFEDELC